MDPSHIISIAAVIFIAILLMGFAYGKKRSNSVRQFARRRGLSFTPRASMNTLEKAEAFVLFSDDTEKALSSVIKGEMDGVSVILFDCHSGNRGTQARASERCTIAILGSARLSVPAFELYPRNIFHSVLPLPGNNDIHFHNRTAFTKAYLLRSGDENGVRQIFTDTMLSYFEKHPGLTVEGNGKRILYYRYNTLIRPDDLHSFLQHGLEVVKLFERTKYDP